jgi:hypothetical protein
LFRRISLFHALSVGRKVEERPQISANAGYLPANARSAPQLRPAAHAISKALPIQSRSSALECDNLMPRSRGTHEAV